MMSLADKIQNQTARVGVIGLGYVGLPLAVAAAARGFSVLGFDIDPEKPRLIAAADSYIDAVSDALLAELTAAGRLMATTDFDGLANCDIIVICVPTPLDAHREPDLSYVESTTRTIADTARAGTLVILESTTWPGTTEEILAPILGPDFLLGFSPEREDPGNAKYHTQSIPKVVSGLGDTAADLVEAFYNAVVDSTVSVANPRTAEAVKITENVFRAVNIALVNELKLVFDAMDIDVWDVIDAAATKPFGFMPFYPGPGLGGHCIPIDPFYLTWKAREYEVPTRFIELAGEINTRMPAHVISRLREVIDQASGKGLRGSNVLLVGIAYKKNVADMRESPAMQLLLLLEEAGANVAFIDPHVPEIPPMRAFGQFQGRKATDPADLKAGVFDAVLIATDHDAIDYKHLLSLGAPIIDTRNAMARHGLPLEKVTKA